jgi:hypothetical protein
MNSLAEDFNLPETNNKRRHDKKREKAVDKIEKFLPQKLL